MSPQAHRVRKSSLKKLTFDNDTDREDTMKSNESKTVQFTTIEIRDYSLCLGDHPDVNRGAPVSLDWEYQSQQSFDIEEYEQRYSGKEKKTEQEMVRLAFEREYTLRKLGYTNEEIRTRSKHVKKDRKNRSKTRRTMIFEPFMIISEETRRWLAERKRRKSEVVTKSRDSISTASTMSNMSSGFPSNENLMSKDTIACSQ